MKVNLSDLRSDTDDIWHRIIKETFENIPPRWSIIESLGLFEKDDKQNERQILEDER